MTDSSGNVTGKVSFSTGAANFFRKLLVKTGTKTGSTEHKPQPTENKVREQAIEQLNRSVQLTSKSFNDWLAELPRLPDVGIVGRKRPDGRTAMARGWDGFRALFRKEKFDEKTLGSFVLDDTGKSIVNSLRRGRLNDREAFLVLDRLRELCIYGGSLGRQARVDKLIELAGDFMRYKNTGFPARLFASNQRVSKQLRKYYAELGKDYVRNCDKFETQTRKLTAQLTAVDHFMMLECHPGATEKLNAGASISNGLLMKAREEQPGVVPTETLERIDKDRDRSRDKRTAELRRSIDGEMLLYARSDTDGKTAPEQIKGTEGVKQFIGSFRKSLSSGKAPVSSLRKLYDLLNQINNTLCNGKSGKAVKYLDMLLKDGSIAPHAVKYCQDRFRHSVAGSSTYAVPDYRESIALQKLLCQPMITIAVKKSGDHKGGVFSLLAQMEKRVDDDGIAHLVRAINAAGLTRTGN